MSYYPNQGNNYHPSYGAPTPPTGYGGGPPPPSGYGPPPGPGGQQGYYGQPQPGGFGPPPGAPPPGAPPHGAPPPGWPAAPQGGSYGQPPPPQGGSYGQPPPPQGGSYGQPPPPGGSYGQPPGPPGGSYGQQPPGGYGYGGPPQQQQLTYLGTNLLADPRWGGGTQQVPTSLPNYPPDQVTRDVETLQKAMKGFGTDESALIKVLFFDSRGSSRPWPELEILRAAFLTRTGKRLDKRIEKEVSGWFEFGLMGRVQGPVEFELELLNRGTKGAGTKETILTEVLIGRKPMEMEMLKAAYRQKNGKTLEETVRGELSLKTERMFEISMSARWEDPSAQGYPVDHTLVSRDIHTLSSSLHTGRTDEMAVASLLLTRSPEHLNVLQQHFKSTQRKTLTKAIKSNFSGHMESALIWLLDGAKHDTTGAWRDAKYLEKSMKGMGTKDEQLVWRLLRAHWSQQHMEAVKAAYHNKYRKNLRDRIKGETSGSYEKMCLAIVDGK